MFVAVEHKIYTNIVMIDSENVAKYVTSNVR